MAQLNISVSTLAWLLGISGGMQFLLLLLILWEVGA